MIVKIEEHSGFCFGVVSAIERAEEELKGSASLYCLGDIVHNSAEVERLSNKGLRVISREEFRALSDCKVLIRAHGEPPETYAIAQERRIHLIDATCPIVLRLQQRVRKGYEEALRSGAQVLIFGKPGHAEVIGLEGQTQHQAIVVNEISDLDAVDFSRPIYLYAQTTQSKEAYQVLIQEIERRMDDPSALQSYDTICGQVANRAAQLTEFCRRFESIIFVSGRNSSNGKYLYGLCVAANSQSHFISEVDELQESWFSGINRVGICGATSTPMWLMKAVETKILQMTSYETPCI